MDYLISITPDYNDLLQALKDTAADKPCIVVVTPQSTSPCGSTTLLKIVKELFNCYYLDLTIYPVFSPQDPYNLAPQSEQIRDSKAQVVILPDLSRAGKGRFNDANHIIEQVALDLVRYETAKPIWLESCQTPRDFGFSLAPYRVYTIRLWPILYPQVNFAAKTFTKDFYLRLRQAMGIWPGHIQANNDPAALYTLSNLDLNGDYVVLPDLGSFENVFDGNGINVKITGAASEEILTRAGLIHDIMTKSSKFVNMVGEASSGPAVTGRIKNFKFMIEYTSMEVETRGGPPKVITTKITHDYNVERPEPTQVEISFE